MVSYWQAENTEMDLDDGKPGCYHIGMDTLKELRERIGLSQAKLAALAETSQPQIRRLENGERELTKAWAERLAPHLGVTATELLFGPRDEETPGTSRAGREFLGERHLPIFAATQGGPGEMVVNTGPIDFVPRPWYLREVKDGYGVVVVGDSMSPKFEPGDIVIVNPRLPALRNRPAIFVAGEDTGGFIASVKLLIRETPSEWQVVQFNPKREFALPKKTWTRALRIVGTYEGS